MDSFLFVACGGGRNSAMLFGMYERGIIPKVITFADTGGEKPETYRAIDRLSLWCDSHLGLPITTVKKRSIYYSLEDQSLKTGTLPSAAYGFRSCSDKWKIQPQDRFMNNYPPAIEFWKTGLKIKKAIGYDAGESRRGSGLVEDKNISTGSRSWNGDGSWRTVSRHSLATDYLFRQSLLATTAHRAQRVRCLSSPGIIPNYSIGRSPWRGMRCRA